MNCRKLKINFLCLGAIGPEDVKIGQEFKHPASESAVKPSLLLLLVPLSTKPRVNSTGLLLWPKFYWHVNESHWFRFIQTTTKNCTSPRKHRNFSQHSCIYPFRAAARKRARPQYIFREACRGECCATSRRERSMMQRPRALDYPLGDRITLLHVCI